MSLKVPQSSSKIAKHLEKIKDLTVCQTNFMQVLLLKIDRRSKPIRKQERLVSHNLKRKRILLDHENFDIISILKKAIRSGISSEQPSKSKDLITNGSH